MKATEFKTIAKDAASNQLAQAFAAAKTERQSLPFNPREEPTREKPCFPPTDPSAAIHGDAG